MPTCATYIQRSHFGEREKQPRRLDAYLALAEQVLISERAPLSARNILERAYLKGIVPTHLHGRTQHKTLQARLSEDILIRRERSVFFRTEPGRFFLRRFLSDPSIPEKQREPMIARRRERDINRDAILTLPTRSLRSFIGHRNFINKSDVLAILKSNNHHYTTSSVERRLVDVFLTSFVVVTKNDKILSYRTGRFREQRDAFLDRRSVGFTAPVTERDYTLFDQEDLGITSSGLKAVVLDLDIPQIYSGLEEHSASILLKAFVLYEKPRAAPDLLAVLCFECPEWFEPESRRLALNDMRWLDSSKPINHWQDFDPWSQLVLENLKLSNQENSALQYASKKTLPSVSGRKIFRASPSGYESRK